jgi:hypothetical protein
MNIFLKFRFADWIDWILIALGTFSALTSAALFPLMFLCYGYASSAFVDFTNSKYNTALNINFTGQTWFAYFFITYFSFYTIFQLIFFSDKCSSSKPDSSGGTDYDNRVNYTINLYITFGFLSLVFNYVYYACFSTSAERQIYRMRQECFIL